MGEGRVHEAEDAEVSDGIAAGGVAERHVEVAAVTTWGSEVGGVFRS